jgi:site-specific DNA-methyltransferase (adenine-specific)
MIDLYCGDCLEIMKNIPDKSVDMILCDLPYGTTACKWDTVIPFDKLWEQYNRIIKDNGAILLFGSEPFSSALRMSNIKNYKYDLYWEKEAPTNVLQLKRRFGKNVETISIFYKKQCTYNPQKYKHIGKKVTNVVKSGIGKLVAGNRLKPQNNYNDDGTRYPKQVLKFNRVDKHHYLHPTQKPVDLCEYLIKTFTNENNTVLDNCMGSGTTGVACKHLGRNFIGIELDKKYFEIAKNRIESELL